jgi:EmrB/QacA subfamily drug resistance transporter
MTGAGAFCESGVECDPVAGDAVRLAAPPSLPVQGNMPASPRAVASIAAAGLFLQSLDSTIITTALPRMAESFDEPAINLGAAINAYVAAMAVCMPASGWLADRFGSRVMFQGAIGVFTLGSLLCALSGSLTEIIGARIIQGAGGAMLTPIGRLVVIRNAPRAELINAMATLSLLQQLGPLLGPPVGGFIAAYASWRWIFLINVPVGLVAIALAPFVFDNDPQADVRPFDKLGFALVGSAFAAIIAALNIFAHGFDEAPQGLALAAVGGALAVAAVWRLRRAAHPLLDLSLLRVATFRINVTGGTPFRIGVGSAQFMLPLLLQISMGFNAFVSGLLIFASAIGQMAMKPSMPWLLRRYGFRSLLFWSSFAVPVALAICGVFRLGTPIALIVATLLFMGFLQSLQFSCLNAIAFADVEPERMSHATSLAQVLQQFAFGTGVAVASVILQSSLALRGASRLTFVDFTTAFLVLAFAAILAAPFYFRLPPDAGHDLIAGRLRKRARPAVQPDCVRPFLTALSLGCPTA